MYTRRLLLLGLAAVILSACDDDSTAPKRFNAKIEIVSGDNQTGEVGTALPFPLVVRVIDTLGNAVAALRVSFQGEGTPDSAITDSRGEASLQWTLSGRAGIHNLYASTYGPGRIGYLSATLKATAVAGPPAGIALTVGDSAVALPETILDSVEARVRDRFGNGLAGVAVRWTVIDGDGEVTDPMLRTDAKGITRAVWRLGPTRGRNALAVAAGDITAHFTATSTIPLIASTVSAGGGHSCALASTGVAYCWGSNLRGQLGAGQSAGSQQEVRKNPVRVRGSAMFVSLVAGAQHTCGLTASGAAYCWGDNRKGQLGDGTKTSRAEPTPVNPGLATFASLAAGRSHTCGITRTGGTLCWGDNTYGQLGDSTTLSHAAPLPVRSTRTFTALVAGAEFTCALTAEGETSCWGRNEHGELGAVSSHRCNVQHDDYYYGTFDEACSLVPLVVGDRLQLVALAAGSSATCGLTRDAQAFCWGAGITSPHAIRGTPDLTTMVIGSSSACATTRDGEVYCWPLGQDSDDPQTPWSPADGLRFESLSGSGSHFCGVQIGERLAYCWGANDVGQLGDGTTQARGGPAKVASPIEP